MSSGVCVRESLPRSPAEIRTEKTKQHSDGDDDVDANTQKTDNYGVYALSDKIVCLSFMLNILIS